MKDLIKKILKEETEDKDLIVPYRLEDRSERYKRIIYKKIQEYIKNGSYWDLDLTYTPIESLPSNLKTVYGSLWLEKSKINKLPDDLTVSRSLDIDNTLIDTIPSGLKVGGSLYVTGTPLLKNYNKFMIQQMIEDKGGYVMGKIYGNDF